MNLKKNMIQNISALNYTEKSMNEKDDKAIKNRLNNIKFKCANIGCTEILYYSEFTNVTRGLEEMKLILVLTNKCVMIVYQAKELVFQIPLKQINRVEVHKERNSTNISIIFYLKNRTREYITTKDDDLSLSTDFYLMFEKAKE